MLLGLSLGCVAVGWVVVDAAVCGFVTPLTVSCLSARTVFESLVIAVPPHFCPAHQLDLPPDPVPYSVSIVKSCPFGVVSGESFLMIKSATSSFHLIGVSIEANFLKWLALLVVLGFPP